MFGSNQVCDLIIAIVMKRNYLSNLIIYFFSRTLGKYQKIECWLEIFVNFFYLQFLQGHFVKIWIIM